MAITMVAAASAVVKRNAHNLLMTLDLFKTNGSRVPGPDCLRDPRPPLLAS